MISSFIYKGEKGIHAERKVTSRKESGWRLYIYLEREREHESFMQNYFSVYSDQMKHFFVFVVPLFFNINFLVLLLLPAPILSIPSLSLGILEFLGIIQANTSWFREM